LLLKPLTARLDRLEELASPKTPPLLLFLLRQAGTESGDESITGIRADGDRLPALQRQDGESVDQLTGRARAMITGGGVVIVHYSREGLA
jgi:hypothetical protein